MTKYKESNGIELPITRTFFDFPRRFESTVVSNVPRGWASGFVAVAGGGEGNVGDRSRRSHRKIGNCKPSTLHVVIMGCTFYSCRFLIKVFPGINSPFSLKILHKHMQPQNATCVSTCRRVRTKHGPGVHGPPLWTGSMDHFRGPGPWTPCHGLGPWTVFLFL